MTNRTAEDNRVGQSDVAATPASAATITTASATIVPANAGRVGVYICNTHATQDAYLALGATAVSATGIYLKAGGGSVYINDYTGIITGIATGASTILTFSEV